VRTNLRRELRTELKTFMKLCKLDCVTLYKYSFH